MDLQSGQAICNAALMRGFLQQGCIHGDHVHAAHVERGIPTAPEAADARGSLARLRDLALQSSPFSAQPGLSLWPLLPLNIWTVGRISSLRVSTPAARLTKIVATGRPSALGLKANPSQVITLVGR